jgi:hypothetical protein
MRPFEFDHEKLLDDLVGGPEEETILQAVRREKSARRRRRTAVVLVLPMAIMILVALTQWPLSQRGSDEQSRKIANTEPAALAEEPSAPVQENGRFQVDHIDDSELLALLDGHPVALVRLPSGEQQLLMVVQNSKSGSGHPRRN